MRDTIASKIKIKIPESSLLVFENQGCVYNDSDKFVSCLCRHVENSNLDSIASILLNNPNQIEKITFNTDQRGSTEANLQLTEKQVAKFKLYLVHWYGIDSTLLDSVEIIGLGESNPIYSEEFINKEEHSNYEKDCFYALNRRIELYFK